MRGLDHNIITHNQTQTKHAAWSLRSIKGKPLLLPENQPLTYWTFHESEFNSPRIIIQRILSKPNDRQGCKEQHY